MTAKAVHLSSDAFLVCLTHALSTEREEVMGLLIGEVDEKQVSHISAVIMLRRSDKQADRVEISPEQLSDASTKAELLAQILGKPMRVLGWHHSHPHITVWPSHVDVRTQAMYQMMDPGFIGLIFSVFNEDKVTKQNRIQITCFQSFEENPSEYSRIEVPFHIVPNDDVVLSQVCLESLVELPKILSQEEEEAYGKTNSMDSMDLLTKLHNASVFTKSLGHIMEVMTGPLIQSLENRLQRNKHRIKELEKHKQELIVKLNNT